jgi:hypothetical protein
MKACCWTLVFSTFLPCGMGSFPAMCQEAPSAEVNRVEFRLTNVSAEPAGGGEDATSEVRSAVTLVVDIRSDTESSDVGGSLRTYTAVFAGASFVIASTPTAYRREHVKEELERWEIVRPAIERGEVKGRILIGGRGELQVEGAKGSEFELVAQAYLESIATLLWPPVPAENRPFEAGTNWSVKFNKAPFTCEHIVRCESVRIWPSGRTEIVLHSQGEQDPSRHVPPGVGGHFHDLGLPLIRENASWDLRGNPPAVTRAVGSQWYRIGSRVREVTSSVAVLSGGISLLP